MATGRHPPCRADTAWSGPRIHTERAHELPDGYPLVLPANDRQCVGAPLAAPVQG